MSDLFEIARDPIWVFVFGLISIVSIFVSIKFYPRKKLSYDVLSNILVFNVHEEIGERIQVKFDGTPIKDMRLVIVKIINSGNSPITTNDYSSQISLNLGENARIFPPVDIKKNPKDLEVSIDIKDSKVILMPTCLNEGNSVILKILGTQISDDIIVAGQIIGGKIKKISEGVKALIVLFIWFFSMIIFLFLVNMITYFIDFFKISLPGPFYIFLFFFSLFVTYYISKSIYKWLLGIAFQIS